MRHINAWPSFTYDEMDDLRRKLVAGVVTEDFKAPHPAHVARAALEGKAWVNFPCWLGGSKWQDGKGFFKLKFKKHTLYIHRASYECFNGPVPAGKLVDHLCRVRGCRQPMHLEAISPKENILRGASQNALLRGELPSPISAEEINPHIWEKPGADGHVLSEEYKRRERDGRDVKRVWDTSKEGPLPLPVAGFWWVQGTHKFNETMFYLNPIRTNVDEDDDIFEEDSRARAADMHKQFVAQVQAYEPRPVIFGVDYPTVPNDALPPPTPPVDFNPAWLAGDVSARMPIRQTITEPALIFGTPFHAESDSFDKYHGSGTAIVLSPTPVEPDWHDDPFFNKPPQSVIVRGTTSLAAFFEYIGMLFLAFMPERVRLWFLR